MRTGIIKRRVERARIIRRRRDIVSRAWKMGRDVPDHLWLTQPGRLSKHNLQCGCWMCKHKMAADKRFKTADRQRYKQEVRAEVAQAIY